MGKTVVVGSQILESMISKERPFRRDVQEISALVVEGVDCILLQQETSDGNFPDKSVLQLAKCCVEAEDTIDYARRFKDAKDQCPTTFGTVDSVAQQAVSLSFDMGVRVIIVMTQSGSLPKQISKYGPESKVLAFTFEQKTAN